MPEAIIVGDSVRERILEAAKAKFLLEGFARVSVDDLAADLVMSKKTFYKHFHSKDDLLAQIVELTIAEINAGLLAIIDSDDSFVGKLDRLMMFVGKQVGKILLPFMQDLQRHAPHLWKRVQEFRRDRIGANIASLFEEGIRGGYIRHDINQRVLLLAFIGTVESVMNPAVLANESFSGDEAMRSILRMLFHGVLTENASNQLQTLQRNQSSHSA
jgi:AcrR family transcriptional regulator